MSELIPAYLAFDCETGGVNPEEHSLLTVYFATLDENFNLISDLELSVKPDDGIYRVTGEALRINNINLAVHDMIAITYKEAATQIYNYLKSLNLGKIKLIPIGHNVAFDIDFVIKHTLSKESWNNFVGYRKLDTGGMALDRIINGHLPKDLKASLGTLADYFGIKFESHTSKGDTWATIKVCQAMLNMTKKQLT